jgi:predicted AAA+ superfamily ATPase
MAGSCAELLNFASISRSLEIPQSSLKRYFALLESAFIIHRLQPWYSKLTFRVVKSPKIYFTDTGLASFLLGINQTHFESNHPLAGHILENFVVNEIKKQVSWNTEPYGMYHFRSHNGREVDIILENAQGRIVAIEVKAASKIRESDVGNMQTLKSAVGTKFHKGIILYRGRGVVPYGPDIHGLPLECVWN